MFDIGFSELFVIAIVALIVLGPERLPRAARFAGLWVRRARAQWYSVKSELEHELATDELRRSLRQTQDELRDAHAVLQRSGADVREELEAVTRQVTATGSQASVAVGAAARSADPDGSAPVPASSSDPILPATRDTPADER